MGIPLVPSGFQPIDALGSSIPDWVGPGHPPASREGDSPGPVGGKGRQVGSE